MAIGQARPLAATPADALDEPVAFCLPAKGGGVQRDREELPLQCAPGGKRKACIAPILAVGIQPCRGSRRFARPSQ